MTEALVKGRSVYWIEDFDGRPPVDELPDGVFYADTTEGDHPCVLTETDLPRDRLVVIWDGPDTQASSVGAIS